MFQLSVSQIDLVSTLSVLMGVPIPFSNLGSVIPYLFLDNATLQQALDANIAQITRFMESEGSQFSSKKNCLSIKLIESMNLNDRLMCKYNHSFRLLLFLKRT